MRGGKKVIKSVASRVSLSAKSERDASKNFEAASVRRCIALRMMEAIMGEGTFSLAVLSAEYTSERTD